MPLEYYSCKLCDKLFNGKRPYQDHIISANHQKKMNQKRMAPKEVDSSARITQVSTQQCSDPFITPRGSSYYCNICKLLLNGPDPMKAHIVGSKHLKLKSKQPLNGGGDAGNVDTSTMKMSDSSKDSSDSHADVENTLEDAIMFDVNDPEKCPDPFIIPRGSSYYCNICKLPLNGPDPMKAHIVGSKHLKMKSKQPLNGGGDAGNVDMSTVKISGGPKDSSHLHADVENSLADAIMFDVNDHTHCPDPFIIPWGSSYYCNICFLPLNGPEPMKAHIVGSKHLKMKSRQPLNGGGDIGNVDLSTMKMSDSPKDSSDLYADVENALPDVKTFKVNDPIEF